MYKEHPSFQPIGKRTKIWRYMDFAKFVSFLSKRSLYFCRVDKLGDPFEGTLSERDYELLLAAIENRKQQLNAWCEFFIAEIYSDLNRFQEGNSHQAFKSTIDFSEKSLDFELEIVLSSYGRNNNEPTNFTTTTT